MLDESKSSPLRRARILMLLEASELAGLTPISVIQLHTLVYFANVLSPIWELVPEKRTVVRKRGGPYYPEVQEDIDALVGRGIVGIEGLSYMEDHSGRLRLDGRFYLDHFQASKNITTSIQKFQDERRLFAFYKELAFAFASVQAKDRGQLVEQDAIYGLDVGEEVIIDFADRKQENFAEAAANFFDQVMPDGHPASPAQKLHLYTQHLKSRYLAIG